MKLLGFGFCVTEEVDTVDGADGFDGCGWRLTNHFNFMQCLSF